MEKINQLILKGIKDGRSAFIGPKIVQIDLNGKCNNDCIGCWVHSPFIKNPPRDKNLTLPFIKVKRLIEDLSRLGTEEIFLSGAGEPFLHPDILEIIELIKNKGLRLNIITNFTLINEEKAKRIIDLGVDMITASIWAASPQTYIKTHPSKKEKDFYEIKNNLQRISELKIERNKYLPHVKIYNVICNLNYKEIQQMISSAIDTQAELIEFQVMDIIEGETSFLALSAEQARTIKEQFEALAKRRDLYFKELGLSDFKSPQEAELKEFPGRFMRMYPNFFLKEWTKQGDKDEREAMHSLICPKGFATLSTKVNPLVNEVDNKLTFKFPKDSCQECPEFKRLCPVDENRNINFNFLKIFSFGSFLRRLNSSNIYEQTYEKNVIDNLPCYVGWTYSRVLSTGEVIPCCKAVFKPLGNIYSNNFLDIWNSEDYQQFRYKAKSIPKSDPYFKEINCYKSCDNVGMNLQIKESIFMDQKDKGPDYQFYRREEMAGEDNLPDAEIRLIVPAHTFESGNLNTQDHNFGEGIVIDGGCGFGFAEYRIAVSETGQYGLWSYYASKDTRPVELYFDGNLIKKRAMSSTTPDWEKKDFRWFEEAGLHILEGEHTLKIYTKGPIPHLHSFALLKGARSNPPRVKKYSFEDIYQYPSSLRLLRDKVKTRGFVNTVFKLFNYIRSGRFAKNYLDMLGIFNGRYAFKGPFHVQIDLTNNCNNNCIGCWCNSPLLEEKTLPPQEKKRTLPFGLVKELLDELSQMGTKEIYFSGGGEPFMHPEIMSILTYAKKKGFNCYVNTNFTLLNKENIRRLIDLGVEHLTVSTWSATGKTYALTHPNKNKETFKQIKENLIFLNRSKIQTPYIKLYNVIFNLNYHELKDMVYLAQETGSESVEFTLIDIVPGKTDKLILNSDQIKRLQNDAQQIAECIDRRGYLDGVLLFRFDSFLRRICSSLDLSKATYDRNIINKIPCYIGWCFSRIMPNGDVNACLKAHRIPTGNLYQQSFSHIWNDERQQYFRKKTLVYEKKDPFFYLIGNDPDIKETGCYKSCDDIGRNIYMHNRIMSLTAIERNLLKIVSKIKQKPNLNPDLQKRSENLVISGIINGREAFTGPEQVVIDITNRCNEKCIGCWLYSPLLKQRPDSRWLRQEINFSRARSLINELADLGTKRIRFTGGGEPFMHPKIMELIEYTKTRGLICCLTTNFSLLNKQMVRDLIRLRVDELAISLWASNEKTYAKTHPCAPERIFGNIKENLKILSNEKKDKPFVTLCNVICNLNYSEIKQMFDFALDLMVDGVYFTLIDTIEGATDSLLLDEEQKQAALKQAEQIQGLQQGQKKRIKLDYFDGFIWRLKGEGVLAGNYDQHRINQIPCYAGWIFARILADGAIVPCCRGVKKPMGNINEHNFKDIWLSQKYNEFRSKAKYLSKSDSYFSEIGCLKMCDNLMHNEQMHLRLNKQL